MNNNLKITMADRLEDALSIAKIVAFVIDKDGDWKDVEEAQKFQFLEFGRRIKHVLEMRSSIETLTNQVENDVFIVLLFQDAKIIGEKMGLAQLETDGEDTMMFQPETVIKSIELVLVEYENMLETLMFSFMQDTKHYSKLASEYSLSAASPKVGK